MLADGVPARVVVELRGHWSSIITGNSDQRVTSDVRIGGRRVHRRLRTGSVNRGSTLFDPWRTTGGSCSDQVPAPALALVALVSEDRLATEAHALL